MLIIGIAGGSGSGKTYLVNALSKIMGIEKCELISQDDYYIDRSGIENFSQINFDHPNSIDFEMVTSHIRELKNGNEALCFTIMNVAKDLGLETG